MQEEHSWKRMQIVKMKKTTLGKARDVWQATCDVSYCRSTAWLTWQLTLPEGGKHKFLNTTRYLVTAQTSDYFMALFCCCSCIWFLVCLVQNQTKVHTLFWSMCLKLLLIYSYFPPLSPTLYLTPLPSLFSWIYLLKKPDHLFCRVSHSLILLTESLCC